MKHFIFFFHIIAFMLGCSTMLLSVFAYIKYKNRLIKYTVYILLALTAILLERTISTYELVNLLQIKYTYTVLWSISCIGSGLLIYTLPLALYDILQLIPSRRKKLIFKTFLFLPLIFFYLYYSLPYKLIIITVISSFVFLVIFYCLWLIYANLKNIKEEEVRIVIKTFFIVIAVFLPYIIVDSKSGQIQLLNEYFPYGMLSIPAFYLVINIAFIYFGIKYFDKFIDALNVEQRQYVKEHISEERDMENFFNKYKITNREKEVILLLAKGYSYNKISEELVISLTTTRTHVYNIYQKTGAKNKVELVNLMKI